MNRQTLVDAMAQVFPAVASNPTAEECVDFLFTGNKIRASDGQILIEATLPEDAGLGCRVPADGFFKYIRAIHDEEIKFDLDETTLTVKAGRKKYKTSVAMDPKQLSKLTLENIDWKPVPAGLIEGIRRVRFAAAKTTSQGALCGVRVEDNHVMAANAFRIAVFTMDDAVMEDGGFNVTQELASQLVRYECEITEWAWKSGVLYFRTPTLVIAALALFGQYPDVMKWVEDTEDLSIEVNLPEETRESLRRLQALQKEEATLDQEVLVSFAEGEMTLTSEGRDGSYRVDEKFDVPAEVAPMKFKIHPGFFSDILGESQVVKVVKVAENGQFARFESEGFVYLSATERVG